MTAGLCPSPVGLKNKQKDPFSAQINIVETGPRNVISSNRKLALMRLLVLPAGCEPAMEPCLETSPEPRTSKLEHWEKLGFTSFREWRLAYSRMQRADARHKKLEAGARDEDLALDGVPHRRPPRIACRAPRARSSRTAAAAPGFIPCLARARLPSLATLTPRRPCCRVRRSQSVCGTARARARARRASPREARHHQARVPARAED